MNRKNLRIATAGVSLIATMAVTLILSGQQIDSSRGGIGVAYDWSHRHAVFSNPTTLEQDMRVRQDPRFWQQYHRRNVSLSRPAGEPTNDDSLGNKEIGTGREDSSYTDWFTARGRGHRRPGARDALKRDWSTSLGPGATVGAGNFPAKFSFDISSANCGSATTPDFVVYNTGVNGSATQASIVAYDNLYTGCSGTVPQTFWAYNTGGAVVTSVVLSLDGSQIAFVQTSPSTSAASLVLLKWKPTVDGATSATPDPVSIVMPGLYPICTAPCATTLPFSGAANDTNSSPFYDYANDALYVGDDHGALHKFQPIFTTGIPAEAGSPWAWPVTLESGFKLSSPVYDSGTRQVFVGSGSDGSSGGHLFAVDGTTGNISQTSPQLAKGAGITSGPIVDSTARLVYVFVGTDTGSVSCVFNGMICSGVYQFSTGFISGGGTETPVSEGSAAAGFTVYPGAFDNSYYTSTDATGSLYVCGQAGGVARLFKLSIVSGSMLRAPTNIGVFAFGPPPPNIPCSPVTEVFNPNQNSGVDSGGAQGTDKIFLSTQGSGRSNPCDRGGNGGCLWALPATAWRPGAAYTVGQVILDDGQGMCLQVVTTAGTSGLSKPNWAVNAGVSTTDGTVTWTGKMCFGSVNPPQSWLPNVPFGVGFSVLDPNGNIEAASVDGGTTGNTQPIWPLNIGAQTADGGQIWVNVGRVDVSSLPVLGGTSGIVVDNTLPTGTLAGGAQIYFSPLGMGFGTCGVGNGCAVQASQSGLN